ncbi:MAG TPA: sulfotransferase [Rhizomicrobium sp.]|jgi:tetratricopeptide (TPR) repeat protein|nr:sulfotransferase [Rhizomicrobium sp.]
MQRSTKKQPSSPSATEAGAPETDTFELAIEQLGRKRPLRSPRLRQIVADMREGRVEGAEQELTALLAKNPRDADALFLKSRALYRMHRCEEAVKLVERCLDIAPDFTAARSEYARQLGDMNRYPAALAELGRLLAEDPGNPHFRQMKARILAIIGENEVSVAMWEALAKENPHRAESWVNYGDSLRVTGSPKECIAAYRRAIACRPSYGQAYWSLANLKTFRFEPADIAAMNAQLLRADLSPGDRFSFQFALGKAYEDMGDFGRSWEQYAKANAAMRVHAAYNPEAHGAVVRANKALFTPEFLRSREGWGCSRADPIFVLGRPRSGSTLVEQILSSHPAIEGTAELPYIGNLAKRLAGRQGHGVALDTNSLEALAALGPAEIEALGEEYLESARLHRKTGRPLFIDKKPDNFLFTGMIRLILPNARIIDARRNPAASCLSTFKLYSIKGRLRITELGRNYRDYVELMAHFDRVLPGRIHRVIYEDMVTDSETRIRRLLDYLGLPFEHSCLRFYETKRTVLTPSSEQVRRPITTDAVDYWRHFEPWLGPLIQSLGSVLAAYPSVPEELR